MKILRDGLGAWAAALIVFFAVATPCQADQALTLEIEGFASDAGSARIVLFDSRASYRTGVVRASAPHSGPHAVPRLAHLVVCGARES